jgi:HNH endonuclease
MTNISCPYCGLALANSKDHIFPQILGGRKTIQACASCNSTFGSNFEAAAKANLEPIMVGLAVCGFKPTTRVRSRKARTDPATGWDYDLNPSGELSLSHHQIERDADGGISRIMMRDDPKQAQKHAASLSITSKAGLQKSIARYTRCLAVTSSCLARQIAHSSRLDLRVHRVRRAHDKSSSNRSGGEITAATAPVA